MFDRFVNASLKHIETMEENSSTKTSYILLFRTQKKRRNTNEHSDGTAFTEQIISADVPIQGHFVSH